VEFGITCHRCGELGHGYRECKPPPAKSETELRERFNRYIETVRAGHVSLAVKRQWVREDWQAYNDEKERARK
jgi:hypothetical protein